MTSPDEDFIPLLSGKPLSEFAAAEFKAHVRLLFWRKPTKAGPRKRLRDFKFRGRILASGKVSVTTSRKPAYVSPDEFAEIVRTLKRGENEVFLALKKKEIQILNHEEAEQMKKELQEIPL